MPERGADTMEVDIPAHPARDHGTLDERVTDAESHTRLADEPADGPVVPPGERFVGKGERMTRELGGERPTRAWPPATHGKAVLRAGIEVGIPSADGRSEAETPRR